MPRIRTIKPEFWTDDKIVELSFPARLLFIGLWNFCDDWGRMEYKPKSIKLKIFPADNVNIEELLGELESLGLIRPYEVEGKKYLLIPNFRKHQNKVSLKSKPLYPAPPWENAVEEKSGTEPPTSLSEGGNSNSKTFTKFLEASRNFKKVLEGAFGNNGINHASPKGREGTFSPENLGNKGFPAQRRELGQNLLEFSRKFLREKEQGKGKIYILLSKEEKNLEKKYINCLGVPAQREDLEEREDLFEKNYFKQLEDKKNSKSRPTVRVGTKENISALTSVSSPPDTPTKQSYLDYVGEILAVFKEIFNLDLDAITASNEKIEKTAIAKAADKMLYMYEKGHEILDAKAYFEKVLKNPGEFTPYWERKKAKDREEEARKLSRLKRKFWKMLRERERHLENNLSEKERQILYERAQKERFTKYGGVISEATVLSIIIRNDATKEILDKHPEFIPVVPKEMLEQLGFTNP